MIMSDFDDEDDDHEPEFPLSDEDVETARLVGRFIDTAGSVHWFAHVGEPLSRELRKEAEAFLAALGFPEATPVPVSNWHDAAVAAETRGYDSPAFDAEEQLRASLTNTAIEQHGEEPVEIMLTHVAAALAPVVRDAAKNAATVWGVRDKQIITAASGAALQTCHNAALLIAANQAEEDHPFALKFRLFERGRWPIGIVGMSFNLF
jgi:hypothetical protein